MNIQYTHKNALNHGQNEVWQFETTQILGFFHGFSHVGFHGQGEKIRAALPRGEGGIWRVQSTSLGKNPHFFGHDLGTFQVVQVKYDLILSNFPFLSFMENIWRFELHQQTNLDVNDWVLPWTCEFNWDKFRCLLAKMGVEQTKRTCESRKEDWSMNTEIFCQEKGGILQTFANDTFLFD